ncbi:hypothetical protein B7P33_13135 [Sediminicola luteus]|uniref:Uncharacterized protein n=1 Tax=Sediminicola luteus TaxID=319238 RepID=A0A2A4G5A4_9FLAO|nr:hypothetical protein B7P33_13135 [Sediminicola luteus]
MNQNVFSEIEIDKIDKISSSDLADFRKNFGVVTLDVLKGMIYVSIPLKLGNINFESAMELISCSRWSKH